MNAGALLVEGGADEDGDVTTVMPAALASEVLASEEPTRVRRKGTYTQTIQRILLLPPRFPEDPDDDAPTEVSDRAPRPAPTREALPIRRPSSTETIDAIDIEPLREDDEEGCEEEWANGSDSGLPLEVAHDALALPPREAGASGSTLGLACVLLFRLALAMLKFACAVGLFLGFAAKALAGWLVFRSWREWRRAWQRAHASTVSSSVATPHEGAS